MKMFKKIISAVSATAMLLTLSSAMLVAHAATPTLSMSLEPTAAYENAGIMTLTISVDGLDDYYGQNQHLKAFQAELNLDPSIFNLAVTRSSGISQQGGLTYEESGYDSSWNPITVTKEIYGETLEIKDDGTTYITMIPATSKLGKVEDIDGKAIMSLTVQVADKTAATTIELLVKNFAICPVENSVAGDEVTVLGSPDGEKLASCTFGEVSDGGDEGNDDTNAPVQVGGGVIEDTVGDSKDAAVAYTQKFTAVAGKKVRWNLTCNKIAEPDKMINGSYTYTIANLETEGDVNIGLIIQYDPSVYENVVVTDGAIVTE